MFPNVGQLKKEGRDNNLYVGTLNFGNLHGTRIVLGGTHPIFFPSTAGDYENQEGKISVMRDENGKAQRVKGSDWDTYKYRYTFPKDESWIVLSVHKNEPLRNYTQEGKRMENTKRLQNLIGITDKQYVKEFEKSWDGSGHKGHDIVKLIPFSSIGVNAGVLNHASLFSILTKESDSSYLPHIHMTWKAFNESIVEIYQPKQAVSLPIGTRIYIPPYEQIKNRLENDMVLETALVTRYKNKKIRLFLEENEDSHFVVFKKQTKMPGIGFFNPRRKSAIEIPKILRTQKQVKRFKARKQPKYVMRVSYRPNGFSGYRMSYQMHKTLKNRPNMMKSKNIFSEAKSLFENLAIVHHLLQRGYIVLDGKYGGKNEIKRMFSTNSYSADMIPTNEDFDYTDAIPAVETLYPTL